MLEDLPGDSHPERVANGEVTGGELAGMMILREEDGLVRTVNRSPVGNPPLEGPPSRVFEQARVPPLQIIEERLGFEPWFGLEDLLDLIPHIGEWVDASSVIAWRLSLRRQSLVIAIRPCGFLIHGSHPGSSGERLALGQPTPEF
jgi:hypothetical protein